MILGTTFNCPNCKSIHTYIALNRKHGKISLKVVCAECGKRYDPDQVKNIMIEALKNEQKD